MERLNCIQFTRTHLLDELLDGNPHLLRCELKLCSYVLSFLLKRHLVRSTKRKVMGEGEFDVTDRLMRRPGWRQRCRIVVG
jgi:hypothetical protein